MFCVKRRTMIKTGVEDRVLHFGSIFVHLFCKKKNGYRSNCLEKDIDVYALIRYLEGSIVNRKRKLHVLLTPM